MHQRAKKELDGKAGNIWTVGEGWALVDKELLGERFRDSGLEFPESCLGEREEPWLRLIGRVACPVPECWKSPAATRSAGSGNLCWRNPSRQEGAGIGMATTNMVLYWLIAEEDEKRRKRPLMIPLNVL